MILYMAKTSKTMLNKSGESENPCLVPDIKRKCFWFSTIENIFPHWECGLVIYGLYYVEVFLLCDHFWRVFIINGCWILSNAFFSHLLRWSWGLKSLLMWYCHVDLCILKNPCITGINPTCSWCMMLLMCCWSWFANILMKIFTSMSISDIGP